MNTRFRTRYPLMLEAGEGEGGAAAAPAVAAPAAAPAPVAAAPAASPAAAPSPEPAASAPSPAATPAAAPAEPAAKWPDDWRTLMAGSDEKVQTLVKRYNTPAELARALHESKALISSTRAVAPPKDATPEQMTEWRKEQGIPETPDKYDLSLPDGMVLGDADKPVVDEFLSDMHAKNAKPEVVKGAIASYLKVRQAEGERIAAADVEATSETQEVLRKEWGSDYKDNVDSIKSMLKHGGDEVSQAIMSARMADGRAVANVPSVVKWLAAQARQLGYVPGAVVPAGGDIGASIADEIKAIEASMYMADGSRNPAYWKDEKKQTRYRELQSAKERIK